jgi:hypothetical protein
VLSTFLTLTFEARVDAETCPFVVRAAASKSWRELASACSVWSTRLGSTYPSKPATVAARSVGARITLAVAAYWGPCELRIRFIEMIPIRISTISSSRERRTTARRVSIPSPLTALYASRQLCS